MRVFLALLLAAVLAGCASVGKIEGEQVVNDRLAVRLPSAWNKVSDPWDVDPYDTWTQEGVPLDQLRLWGGIASGMPLMTRPQTYSRAPDAREIRVPTFRAGMTREQLVSLFEQFYANAGTVRITRVDPDSFAGQAGVRFEFTLARRIDDVVLQGVGWAAARENELYAATFVAPRLSFFQRLRPMAESVVKTARIKAPTADRLKPPPT
jgi:hypothetical protein